MWHYLEFDERRAVAPALNWSFNRDGYGTMRYDFSPKLVWRPTRAVRVDGGVRYVVNNDDAQWVENVVDTDAAAATHYVFGRLEQRTVSMTLRANYTMSPTLSFQSYAEPFVSAGAYTNYKELTNGRADAIGPLKRHGTRELASLTQSFMTMAKRLQDRSDYLSSFANHVSHELKSPLTAIKGFAQLARRAAARGRARCGGRPVLWRGLLGAAGAGGCVASP